MLSLKIIDVKQSNSNRIEVIRKHVLVILFIMTKKTRLLPIELILFWFLNLSMVILDLKCAYMERKIGVAVQNGSKQKNNRWQVLRINAMSIRACCSCGMDLH